MHRYAGGLDSVRFPIIIKKRGQKRRGHSLGQQARGVGHFHKARNRHVVKQDAEFGQHGARVFGCHAADIADSILRQHERARI